MKKTARKTSSSVEGKENMVAGGGLDERGNDVVDTFTKCSGDNSIACAGEMIVKMEENEVLPDLEASQNENQQLEEVVGDCPTLVDMIGSECSMIQLHSNFKYVFNTNSDVTGSPSRGIKRTLEDIENLDVQEKSVVSKKDTLDIDPIELKKQCKQLSKRIKQLESNCMPRPQHPEVVKYFIEAGNTLSNTENNISEETNKQMMEIIYDMRLKKSDVLNCKRQTATATARQLIRLMYPAPEPDFVSANVDKTTIDSIICLAQCLTPIPASNKSQLKKAIGNYFAARKYANKRKSMMMTWKQDKTNDKK